MSKTTAFQFERVLVVSRGHNIYTKQLQRAGIRFLMREPGRYEKLKPDQQLIMVVNEGVDRVATPLKEHFPSAQVVVCSGGKKNFTPRITVVYGADDWQVCYFQSWQEFLSLIGRPLKRQARILPVYDSEIHFHKASERPYYLDTADDLAWLYGAMGRMSGKYLEWYAQWLDEVGRRQFECAFDYPKKVKHIKKVTLPMSYEFIHRGLPVLAEESLVTFHTRIGSTESGTVEFANEETIIIRFPWKLKRERVNSFQTFSVDVRKKLVGQYQEATEAILKPGIHSLPLMVMSGVTGNNTHQPLRHLYLTKPQWRMLNQDASQTAAMADMMGRRTISIIQGPAGTGKTMVTSLGVKQFAVSNKVILLVSHSNQGLDNVMVEVAKQLEDDETIFRLGNSKSNITDKGLRFHRSKRFNPDNLAEGLWLVKREVDAIVARIRSGKPVVIACTMTSFMIDKTLQRLKRKKGFGIDIAFVDEASRGFMYELLPIVNAAKEKVVFVGDPDQLGNIDISPDAKKHLAACSFTAEEIGYFSQGWFNCILLEQWLPQSLLGINRRSLPVICRLVSDLFYGGRLISGRFDPADNGLVMMYDTVQAKDNGEAPAYTSFCNHREANIMVSCIVNRLAAGLRPNEIAGITPYRGQINLVRAKLRQEILFNTRLASLRQVMAESLGLEQWNDLAEERNEEEQKKIIEKMNELLEELLEGMINTVDAFQGSQRKVIVISFVRSNSGHEIGFNENVNRLRVAMSRAENRLVIIANSETFLECKHEHIRQLFRRIMDYIKENGRYIKIRV